MNDPTGLGDVRARLGDEVTRRWTTLAREVKRAILQSDALSISDKAPRLAQPTADKARMFQRWLDEKLMAGVAGHDGRWLAPHIEAAAGRGARRVAVGDAGFDPGQERDNSGKWSSGGGVSGVGEAVASVERAPQHRTDFIPDPAKPIGSEAKAYVLEHGRETKTEYLIAVDKAGKVVSTLAGDKSSVGFTAAMDAAADNPDEAMVIHHNHPASTSLSGPDIAQLGRPGIAAIWAHGNNGKSYRAELTSLARANERRRIETDPLAGQQRLYAARERASEVISDAIGPVLYSPNKDTQSTLTGIANLNHAGWVNGALHQAGIINYHSSTENAEAETALSFGIQGAIGEGAFKAKEIFYGKGGGGAHRPDRPAEPVRRAGDLGIAFGEAQGPARRHAAQDGADRLGGAASAYRRQFGDLGIGDAAPSSIVCHAATVSHLAGICDDVSQRAHAGVAAGLLLASRPMQIARLLDQAFSHGLYRSRMLAEHAVTQAYSQATLDALEARGVTHVGTISEPSAKGNQTRKTGGFVNHDADPDDDEVIVEGVGGARFRVVKTAQGYVVIAMDFDPDEPRDESGKWTSSGSITPSLVHTGGSEFVSPSVASHLDFDEARKALDGSRQKAMLTVAHDIDGQLGLKESERSVIGAWSDGAENSVLAHLPDASWDEIKLSAAMKGYVGDQKAVLAFKQDDGGDALLYQMHAAGDLKGIHQRLLNDGLAFHSLAPTSDGADVYVADLDGSAHEGIKRAAEDFHGQVTYQRGHAEFIGTTQETGTDREIRDDARRAYEGLIHQSPVQGGAEVWRRHRDRWSAAVAQAVADAWFADAARKTPQPKHPRHGRFAKAHVVAREMRRSKRTGQFRRQGLAAEEQRKEELTEARFGRVIGRLDVQTQGDDRVCDNCDAISANGPYGINEARSLIPAHPNCRCLFVAAGTMRDAVMDFDPDEPRDPQGRWTALSGSQGHSALISSRPVTASGRSAEERASAETAKGIYKTIDMAAMKADKAQFKANADLFKDAKFYPGMRADEAKGGADEVAEAVKNRMVDNLVFLANKVKDGDFGAKDDFQRWAGWYEGAHTIAEGNAKTYGTDIASASGVIAALSPQNDWNGNVYQADVVMSAMTNKQGMAWDAAMSAKSKAIWKGQRLPMAKEIEGKTLAELARPMPGDPSDPEELRSLSLARRAMWIRTENEAHETREHRQVNPEGTFGDLMRTKAGLPTPAKWKSISAIANAVKAYESKGDANQLSEAMGDRHKVRSFYNNILDPNSKNGDVTIDTHAVGAAWLTPTTSEDVSVYHALNTSPLAVDKPEGFVASKGSAVSGVKGTYGFYAQAYREAAEKLHIQPRQLQSVVWEAKQRLFSKTVTGTKVKGAVDAVWRKYHSGEINLKAAQHEVVKAAQGSVG